MHKARWSAAALVAALSVAGFVSGGPQVLAADSRVAMVEGSQSDPYSWQFAPVEITVPVGTTVVWKNNGQLEHTATAEDGSFDSKSVKPGGEFSYKFTTPGDFKYFCEPHRTFMTGVVKVTGGAAAASPPTTAAPTTTTTRAPAPGAPVTTTTAKAPASTTTTTALAAAGSTTTTTAAGATGVTTTLAPVTTPTSAPEVGGVTTTTAGEHGEEQSAAADHGSGGSEEEEQESSPIGIAFVALSTVLLVGISAKLLASRS